MSNQDFRYMRVRTQDGFSFQAEDHSGVVEALRRAAPVMVEDRGAFRREAAHQLALTGRKVRADTDEHFVADLYACGYLRPDGIT